MAEDLLQSIVKGMRSMRKKKKNKKKMTGFGKVMEKSGRWKSGKFWDQQ